MRHHAKTFGGVDQNDVVGNVRTRLRRCGTNHQRRRIDNSVAAGAFFQRVRRAAGGAKAAAEVLSRAAGGAGLIDDGFRAGGPVVDPWMLLAHRTRSRNMLTCDDNTPPSPCSSAIEASRTWRLPARPVICSCVSTRCAIAPPTPQCP